MTKKLIFISLTFLYLNNIFGGVSGKIMGVINDTETGDPLVGANVIIQGTALGAASDINGYFVILNVPPGYYNIKASVVGYAEVTVENIRVEIDLTSTVNFEMKTEVLQGEAVTVQAERKLVKVDVAASQVSISSDQIEKLPVSTISDVIGLQAGISGFEIRGGGENQTMFVVDGIVMNDERTGKPTTGIPLSSIQDISVQTGGFNAEYHNVRSGVVNVVTKEGSPDYYSGNIQIRYSPPTQKHFGISPYDPQSYWFKPYTDPEVMWTGTGNGKWDEYTLRQYPQFDGWNRISQQSMEDSDPSNDLSPTAAYQLFSWEHRKKGAIEIPDYNIDAGFGGPVPIISDVLGNLRFYASFRQDEDMYLYKVSRPGLKNKTSMLKVTSDISPTIKLSLIGRYGELFATTSSRGGLTSYFDSPSDLAKAVDRVGFTIPWRLYTNNYWCPTTITNSSIAAKITHQLNQKTFYKILVRFDRKEYSTHPTAYRDFEDVGSDGIPSSQENGYDAISNPDPEGDDYHKNNNPTGTEGNGILDIGEPTIKNNEIFPGWFVDQAPVGFSGITEYSNEGRLSFGGAISTARDTSVVKSFSLKTDFTSQIHPQHEFRTGFEFIYNDLNLRYGSQNFFLPGGNYLSTIRQYPYRFYYYFQDKLEIKGFVAIIGLNMDYINPNGEWYVIGQGKDFYTDIDWDFFSSSYNDMVEKTFPVKKVEPQITFSPRLAISHPITEVSKLYFNYGHYRQMPEAEDLYRVRRHPDGNLFNLGDPTLPLARTISYELGYDHAFLNSYLLHVSAYYKDVTDQQDYTDYTSINGKVNYSQLTTSSYEDIRGLELGLSKIRGQWITGQINYEYRVETSGHFGVREYYDSPKAQRDYIRKNPEQTKAIPTPRLKSVLNFHTPFYLKPRILADWYFNLTSRWTSGKWFTYNPNSVPGLIYNVQWKDYYLFDIKLSKIFTFGKTRIKFFVDVYNVFNLKYFSSYGYSDTFDWDHYMQSLHLPNSVASKLGYNNIPGKDQPGDYRAKGTKFVPLKWISSIFKDEETMEYLDPSTLHQGPLELDREIYYYDNSTGEFMSYENGEWSIADSDRIDKILSNNAYIDMPNQKSFVFLNPRDFYFGLNISYDF